MTTTVVVQNPTEQLGNQARVRIHAEQAPPHGQRIAQSKEGEVTHLGDALRTRITISHGPEADPLKTRVQLEDQPSATLVQTRGVMVEAPKVREVRDPSLVQQPGEPLSAEQIIEQLTMRRKLAAARWKALDQEIKGIDEALRYAKGEQLKAREPKTSDTEPATDSSPEITTGQIPEPPPVPPPAPEGVPASPVLPADTKEPAKKKARSSSRGKTTTKKR
jgi:hypothetical protein